MVNINITAGHPLVFHGRLLAGILKNADPMGRRRKQRLLFDCALVQIATVTFKMHQFFMRKKRKCIKPYMTLAKFR